MTPGPITKMTVSRKEVTGDNMTQEGESSLDVLSEWQDTSLMTPLGL